MSDWDIIQERNKERLSRLNLPNFKSSGKVFIFDKYCPYSLDVIDINPVIDKDKLGIHGTMAGQIVKLVAGDDVEFYGSGYTYKFDEIVDFCIENNIRVINSSITCSYSDEKDSAIKRYAEWGGIWVSSAGNNDNRPVYYPGRSQYTICVSATNTEDSNGPEVTVTTDSNWSVRNLKVGRIGTFNGTSCSAPVIAGCVRLILDAHPEWKLKEIIEFLQQNSITDMKSLEEYERFFSFSDEFGKEEEELNSPDKIILHHSLTKDGEVKDFDAIKRYHIETKGWQDIGYHYVIELVGDKYEILKGRDEKTVGAHTIGQNATSIGICLVGNFDVDFVPYKQFEKLLELIKDIFNRYGTLPIYGHCDFPNPDTGYRKTCPGTKFPWKELKEAMVEQSNDWRIEEGLKVIDRLKSDSKLDSPEYWQNLIKEKPEFGALLLLIEKMFDRK